MLTGIQQPRSRLVIIAARNFQKFLIAALLVKPGATGGAYRGRAPQMTACALPNENCAPPARTVPRRNLQAGGYTGVEIETQIGVFCGLTSDFMTFLGRRPFFFFFWRSPVFGRKNRFNFQFRPENPPQNR